MHLKDGYTPLHYAANNESPQAPAIVEALLKAKAKIEATHKVGNQEGDAVLRLSSRGGAIRLGVWRWHVLSWPAVGWGRCGHGCGVSGKGLRGWVTPKHKCNITWFWTWWVWLPSPWRVSGVGAVGIVVG